MQVKIKREQVINVIFILYKVIIVIISILIVGFWGLAMQTYMINNPSLEPSYLKDLFWILEEKLGSFLTFLIAIPLLVGGIYIVFKLGASLKKEPEKKFSHLLKYGLNFIIKFFFISIIYGITREAALYVGVYLIRSFVNICRWIISLLSMLSGVFIF